MDVLETGQELVEEHQRGLERELTAAELEQICDRWPAQLLYDIIALEFSAVPVADIFGDPDSLRLPQKCDLEFHRLICISAGALHFDDDLFARLHQVFGDVHSAEAAASNQGLDFILVVNHLFEVDRHTKLIYYLK